MTPAKRDESHPTHGAFKPQRIVLSSPAIVRLRYPFEFRRNEARLLRVATF
jgi:hypothetical protein